jgi:CHASE1-domain containing sensor protein
MRNYCIINSDEVSSVNFDQVAETSADTLRYSIDGTQTFVKYEGTQPSFLSGKQEYTHSEILAILATDEWTSDDII